MSETDWKQARVALEGLHDMAMKVSAYEQVRQIGAQIATVDAIIDLDARVAALESRGTAAITPEGAAALAESPSDEAAAIANFRARVSSLSGTGFNGSLGIGVTDARHLLAALDRVTAQVSGGKVPYVFAERIRDLEAQLAAKQDECDEVRSERNDLRAQLAARTDATPLEEVEITHLRSEARFEEPTRMFAKTRHPVYEHAPRPVAPDYDLVGACVVRGGGAVSATFTYDTHQAVKEARALGEANEYGGTPYRLYAGEPITEATP